MLGNSRLSFLDSLFAVDTIQSHDLAQLVTPQQKATRILDRWIVQSETKPVMIDLDGCSADHPMVLELLRQFGQSILDGTGRCLLFWSGPQLPTLQPEAPWTRIILHPLSATHSALMIKKMLHHLAPPPWLSQLQRLSAGDPRWITELVWAQIRAGLPEQLSLDSSSLSHLTHQRLADLPAPQKQLLALLALCPRAVPLTVLEQVAPDWAAPMHELLARDLVTRTGAEFRITDPSLYQIARQLEDGQDQPPIHATYAVAWRQYDPQDQATIAHHLLRAGQIEAGAALCLEGAAAQEDLEQATLQLPKAHPLWPQLQERLAQLERGRGQLDQALDRAAALQQEDANHGRLLQAELLLDAGRCLPTAHPGITLAGQLHAAGPDVMTSPCSWA